MLEPGCSELAPGLLLSPSLVRVINGVTHVPIVNVGTTGTTVHAKQVLGRLYQVEEVEGQQLNFVGESEEVVHVTIVSANTAMGSHMSISATISALQWPGLTPEEERQVKELLEKYHQVFAKHEGDLGCTNEIEHEIPLTDNVPVRQRYRRIPPTQWQAVKLEKAVVPMRHLLFWYRKKW